MGEKNTQDLEQVLGKTHLSQYERFCREQKESMAEDEEAFIIYVKELIRKKGLTQQMVFLKADIPERYGYKLLSGEKHTRQRDILLRIFYAAEFTLEETQRALKKYEMAPLYVKIPRDAFLMIVFNERPGSIIEVNELLKKNQLEPLRTSGVQD